MSENIQSLSQRGSYSASPITKFLWWLSTAEPQLLEESMIDRNRYAITGMTVLGTWLFATFAWIFFFTTVTDSTLLSILLGIFMGGIILTIDRALIKGITTSNKMKLLPLLFRGLLACTIGFFMAQPALLYLFNKEVHLQISLDNEQKKRTKLQQLDSLFNTQKTALLQQKKVLQSQLDTRYNEVSAARDAYITETDGTGGSKKPGLKDIAKAKQNEYERLDKSYTELQQTIAPQQQSVDSSLNAIEVTKHKEQNAFEQLLNDGFLTRTEALQHLIQNNSAVQIRYYLLVILLMLIELMPVIAKTLLPTGVYEEKVRLREQMEKTIAQNNNEKELALKELYNQTAFDQDSKLIQSFFEQASKERKEKLIQLLQEWQQDKDTSFDTIWKKLKEEMFSKQEN